MTIITSIGAVTLPDNLLIDEETLGETFIHLRIAYGQMASVDLGVRQQLNKKPVVEVDLLLKDESFTWVHTSRTIIIELPYKPKKGEELEKISAGYIGQGSMIKLIVNGYYNANAVGFTTNHLSVFCVYYPEINFNDFYGYDWAKAPSEIMAAKGVTNGTGLNGFSPGKPITRSEFMTMIVRLMELEADVASNFSDVFKEMYYYDAIAIAKALGITTGIGGDQFKPDEMITREDMMVMAGRGIACKGVELDGGIIDPLESYKDKTGVSGYAYDYCRQMVNEALIQGNNWMLNPRENATRAEAVVYLYRLYKMLYTN